MDVSLPVVYTDIYVCVFVCGLHRHIQRQKETTTYVDVSLPVVYTDMYVCVFNCSLHRHVQRHKETTIYVDVSISCVWTSRCLSANADRCLSLHKDMYTYLIYTYLYIYNVYMSLDKDNSICVDI